MATDEADGVDVEEANGVDVDVDVDDECVVCKRGMAAGGNALVQAYVI